MTRRGRPVSALLAVQKALIGPIAKPKKARAPRAKPSPPRKAPVVARPAPGSFITGHVACTHGARDYRLYTPRGRAGEVLPLVVMLHGCGQTADGFAISTRMNRIAERQRFGVLYPEQDRQANLQGCWNWYDTDTRRAYREAATLLAAIDQVVLLHPLDASRVAVAGLSAGASMAALLASRHPARFAAVVMHSGVPPGAAHSTGSALRAMLGRVPSSDARRANALNPIDAIHAIDDPDHASPAPALLVIHGTADHVVATSNGEAAVQAWATAARATAAPSRVVRRGQRRAMTVTDFKRRGQTVATLCLVQGLGHAWSGGATSQRFSDANGPDASRMVWAFAARQFARRLQGNAG